MYERIFKGDARKMFNAGKTVYICPHKVNPESPWCIITPFKKDKDGRDNFDKLIMEYTYYNCNNELGYYCAYYEYSEDEKSDT